MSEEAQADKVPVGARRPVVDRDGRPLPLDFSSRWGGRRARRVSGG